MNLISSLYGRVFIFIIAFIVVIMVVAAAFNNHFMASAMFEMFTKQIKNNADLIYMDIDSGLNVGLIHLEQLRIRSIEEQHDEDIEFIFVTNHQDIVVQANKNGKPFLEKPLNLVAPPNNKKETIIFEGEEFLFEKIPLNQYAKIPSEEEELKGIEEDILSSNSTQDFPNPTELASPSKNSMDPYKVSASNPSKISSYSESTDPATPIGSLILLLPTSKLRAYQTQSIAMFAIEALALIVILSIFLIITHFKSFLIMIRTFVETLPIGIVFVDENGKVIIQNNLVEVNLGHAQHHNLQGKNIHQFDGNHLLLKELSEQALEKKTKIQKNGVKIYSPQLDETKILDFCFTPIQSRSKRDLGIIITMFNQTPIYTTNEKLQQAVSDLKQAQTQIIIQEKLASLGALTAGIAHEIKNPLNFINNFSEVSLELLDELKTELLDPSMGLIHKMMPPDLLEKQTTINEIIRDLSLNMEKINEHGQRSDRIIRSMLMHSREGKSEKTSTHVNNLLEEYSNMAYHGMRAKDISFNVTIQSDLDPKLESILAVGTDLGRVFLNLLSNAFYAVNEKSKGDSPKGYLPLVWIKSINHLDSVEIRIGDNGNGIPESIQGLIFNPFFTTKPTGQGNTGLGLSISYEIIVQEHQGTLNVESKEQEYTEFVIVLPKQPKPLMIADAVQK